MDITAPRFLAISQKRYYLLKWNFRRLVLLNIIERIQKPKVCFAFQFLLSISKKEEVHVYLTTCRQSYNHRLYKLSTSIILLLFPISISYQQWNSSLIILLIVNCTFNESKTQAVEIDQHVHVTGPYMWQKRATKNWVQIKTALWQKISFEECPNQIK